MGNLNARNGHGVVHVVDDDLAMRVALDSMLRSVGYEVLLYETGSGLIEKAMLGLSGCVVLDVRLPGPGGLEIQRRLRELGSDVPIIFITGHGDVEMAVRAMKANAIEFLTKPFRDQDLLDAISCAMEASGARAQILHARMAAQQRLRTLSAREPISCLLGGK
jgi:FixJ family two-component response regulator